VRVTRLSYKDPYAEHEWDELVGAFFELKHGADRVGITLLSRIRLMQQEE
jgi:hypothetical protein